MPSFNIVNYSLRPNKSIQRSLVFESLRQLQGALELENLLYIGFGSVWFTDFHMAHKLLNVRDMISIEADDVGFKRAKFNQPFKTVRVENGFSYDVLPELLADDKLNNRPWIIWLDYDRSVEETTVDDIRLVIERAPQNSTLLVTFNASGGPLGKPAGRPERLKALLGAVVPDDLARDDCKDEQLPITLADLVGKFMVAAAASISRPGGFVPGFQLIYRDATPMVTVGGILPAKGAVPAVNAAIRSSEWLGISKHPITTPHLTLREAAVLQAQLPRTKALTRKTIQQLGFDLEDDQIQSFEKYYRYYPAFAQIMG